MCEWGEAFAILSVLVCLGFVTNSCTRFVQESINVRNSQEAGFHTGFFENGGGGGGGGGTIWLPPPTRKQCLLPMF